MLGCILITALYNAFFQNTTISSIKPVFWLESIMVWAFGISWFVKSQPFWRDPPDDIPQEQQDTLQR
jgi:hypothetical protein